MEELGAESASSEEVVEEKQLNEVEIWRRDHFKQILPSVSGEDIQLLVDSDASPHDALDLRNRECPDHLIVRILR